MKSIDFNAFFSVTLPPVALNVLLAVFAVIGGFTSYESNAFTFSMYAINNWFPASLFFIIATGFVLSVGCHLHSIPLELSKYFPIFSKQYTLYIPFPSSELK